MFENIWGRRTGVHIFLRSEIAPRLGKPRYSTEYCLMQELKANMSIFYWT